MLAKNRFQKDIVYIFLIFLSTEETVPDETLNLWRYLTMFLFYQTIFFRLHKKVSLFHNKKFSRNTCKSKSSSHLLCTAEHIKAFSHCSQDVQKIYIFCRHTDHLTPRDNPPMRLFPLRLKTFSAHLNLLITRCHFIKHNGKFISGSLKSNAKVRVVSICITKTYLQGEWSCYFQGNLQSTAWKKCFNNTFTLKKILNRRP